ncbi:MAG: glycosyltransferase family 4 protein [Patescibacteria group bacterium]
MKIIQANKFYYLRGGTERYLFRLSRWLESQGNEVIPFAMQHQDNLETKYSKYFPSFVQTEKAGFGFWALKTIGRMFHSSEAKKKMQSLIDQEHPQLCHIHNIYTQLSPSFLPVLKRNNIPVVMTVHDHHLVSAQYNIWTHEFGYDVRGKGALRAAFTKFHKDSFLASLIQGMVFSHHRLSNAYAGYIDCFVVPCAYMKRQMVTAGYRADLIHVNPFGIDPARIEPCYENKGYVLFIGRLSQEKGIETVIALASSLPDVKFKIAGRGPQEEYLHRLAHPYNNIEFVGFKTKDALRDLYRGAICVLAPSRVHEVFPFSVLEAMAAGKPVIASKVGGIPEIIEDHISGILVDPADQFAWSESLMRIVYDCDFRVRMGKNARLSIETNFTAERHYQDLMRVYKNLSS